MTRPRVFVVHQPTGRDRVTGQIGPTMDLSPATAFGPLVFVLGETENPFADVSATVARVWGRMSDEGFSSHDYVLLVGSPILIGIVTAVAAAIADGRVKMLQWSGKSRDGAAPGYHALSLNLNEPVDVP